MPDTQADPHLPRAASRGARRAGGCVRDRRDREAPRAGGRHRGAEPKHERCSSCSRRADGSSRSSTSISAAAASCARHSAKRRRSPTPCSPCRGSARRRSSRRDPRRRRTAGSGRSREGKVMTAFAMTEPEAGSDVGGIATTARHEGCRLRPRRHQDAHLQRRDRRSLRRVRVHRPRQGRQGDQLLSGAGGCAWASGSRARKC